MAQQDNRQRYRRDQQAKAEEKEFEERVVNVARVARVVKGGRRFRFRALVVIGDKKGRVGIGISKGADVTSAVAKSVDVAKKNLISIALYKETIPHETQAKVGGADILIKPASAGTGLIAGGVVRTILELAGVHNALSKSLGSTNKINTSYATIKALKQLVPAKEWITRLSRNLPAAPAKPASNVATVTHPKKTPKKQPIVKKPASTAKSK